MLLNVIFVFLMLSNWIIFDQSWSNVIKFDLILPKCDQSLSNCDEMLIEIDQMYSNVIKFDQRLINCW